MKPKNINKYKDLFKDISDDQYDRIKDYLDSNQFTDKDYSKFYDRLKELSSIEWSYLRIILNIIPEATPRPRLDKKGFFYVTNSKKNSNFVKQLITSNLDIFHLISTPCNYIVNAYFPIPKYFSKVDTLLAELGLYHKITIPDWDNIGKTYSDMIQKWILCNDSLIIRGEVNKFYSLKPRVEIIIKYMNKHFSEHDRKLIEQSISYKNEVDNYEHFKAEENKFQN